ncbi:acyltransferase family protein [Chitinophaga nivalis]|uniref:Acyltransferase n=1 Tax=Chitinophaga nivalis TaxID=2991709 RepID=A0ABT3IEQ9_9BACT|nr:acyltransferase [Chitinophaga nivalis]MCW3467868.1 acyltransferase [Chitinophaga nivalis]MCW3482441.1 acyltransferase [Chitinophaga nivalis]
MAQQLTNPPHFYTLDAIRGVAAIIVVLYHWQLFYYAGDIYVQGGYEKTQLPWYPYLAVFYTNGMVAVDLFFLLSGFIFFWLYSNKIFTEKTSFRNFMGYRLTRLYPIHIVTLLFVGFLQWIMLRNSGHFFIIQYNDGYHFLLNLLMMQNWGFEKGASFNGPSWSVSVEVFLYVLFFIICRLGMQRKIWLLILLIPLGALLQYYTLLGKGVYSFFYGALIYYLYTWLLQHNKVNTYLPAITIVTLVLWVFLFVEYKFSYIQSTWLHTMKEVLPDKDEKFALSTYGVFRNLFFRTTVSPLTILALALWETKKGMIHKNWAALGNCSYAIYLLHFPLQIIFVLITDSFGISRQVLHSPYVMLLFFLILLPVSYFTYYYFEFPAQQLLRRKFLKKETSHLNIIDAKLPI